MSSPKEKSVSEQLDAVLESLDVFRSDLGGFKESVNTNIEVLEKDLDNVYKLVEAVDAKVAKQ